MRYWANAVLPGMLKERKQDLFISNFKLIILNLYRTYKLHVMKRQQAWSRWITILSICFVCSSAVAESDFSILLDSLRNKIQESQGKDKIEVLSLLARLDSRSRDYDKWEK